MPRLVLGLELRNLHGQLARVLRPQEQDVRSLLVDVISEGVVLDARVLGLLRGDLLVEELDAT